ncbi:hypothetical protein TSAR_011075 [Trichomalopsis sarcophagae]|uniref:RZ-type domain-containing protein n=1 Tax=Trichomalopsis sarcophagae TaxID=543379 RepID=A0A232F3L2_9HYME|nr:hypothetical protein TSAR_011075 [Trichomalopsis sarcophagae]
MQRPPNRPPNRPNNGNNRNENLRDPGRNVNLANNYAGLQYPNLMNQRLRLLELIGHQNLTNYHQLGQQGGINQNNEGQRQRHVGINENDQGVQRRDGNVNQNNQEQYGRGRHNNPNNQRQQRREGNENNNGQHQRREGNQNNNGQYQRRKSNRSQQNQGQRRQSSYNRSERNSQSSRNYFTFTYLDDLSKKNSDDVTAAIVNHKDEFEKFLNDDIRPDMFVLTLRVLNNICQANFTEMVTSVLGNACSPKFLSSLQNFLNKLPFETVMEKQNNRLYHNDKNKFWSDLAQFFKKLIELMPTKARDELTIVLEKLPKMLPNIEAEQNFKVEESIRNSLMNMSEDLKEEINRIEIKNKVSKVRPNEQMVEGDPPEDFRLLSVIPTMQDLQNTAPFYRKCRVENAYDSVEHYLDVQFRLLREDFISPLRSGIQEYLHGSEKNRNSDVRVYKKVNLKAPDVKEKNVGIELNFGTIKGVNWKCTKRFMYGGLLLLSSDNFRTVLFVTIIDRNDNQLEKGCLLVEPCRGTNITREMYDIDYVMLESKIYFEPYLAVLTALQQMNEDNFPMEPYLVKGDRNSRPPRYLTSNYGTTLKYKNMLLPIAQGQYWPPAQQLGLDESQYQAFRCALTQDFAVIQGPPGTGKTFIALEIVSTLLANHEHWKRFGPIVVVCLTNHALDQFLEGILVFTDSIVRVGSRSKSEKMKKYTLMERRKIVSTTKHSDAKAVMYETKHELETVLSSMKKARLNVQLLETPNAIVPLACLVNYLGEEVLRFSSNEEFVKWLLGEEIVQNLRFKKPVEPAKTVQEQLDDGPGYYDDDENHMDNDLELNYDFKVDDNFDPIFPIESINAKFEKTREDIEEYTRMAAENKDLQFDPTPEWREMCRTLTNQRLRLQQYLAQHPLLGARRDRGRNITNDSNWRTYWQWVLISHQSAMDELAKLEREYHHLKLRLNEVKQYVDLDVLKEHLIVGLTTNGAAKLHLSLRALRAPIVLVEEAAEILEGHVVCSMTKHCQHAILIGDHKQLRPKASVYKLGKDFNLNISLFERMVKTRGDCTQLAHQHRMRPQFAKLITPSIYDTLYNHESVFNRDNIKGVVKNLFFLHHENHESSHNNEESCANQHECVFLVAFATYLIKQGYNPSEITILCTYTGQLFALMKETGRYTILKQMRVTTVDNYQGEENKIILLSLVRNNGEGNTGFLKEENRVCVALSRARDGMYIMGNMNDLVVKNTIWPKIKKVLEEENAIGNALELRCQIHPQQITQIKDLQDFQKCPEGGCSKKCDLPLSCGHICTSVCHILDREHKEYSCKQPCIMKCPHNHPCPLRCYQGCKPCKVKVRRKLRCGHTMEMLCSTDPETFACTFVIDAILPDCNHAIKKPCYLPIKDAVCTHPCEENRLPCGHVCELKCHITKDPEHLQVKKRSSCGHDVEVKCCEEASPSKCSKKCTKLLNCGHPCSNRCKDACTTDCQAKEKCDWGCEHRRCSKQCSEPCNIEPCNEPCKKRLRCGHPCVGFCGDPCPPLCRICNKDDLTELFFGNEDEEDARFVYLEDCNHCIESEGLTKWVTKFSEFVQMKVCPKCKTPIRKCMRLMNQIKSDLKDVMSIKEKNFSHNQKNLETKQLEHIATLRMMSANRFLSEFPNLKEYLSDLWNRGIPVQNQRKQVLNGQEIETFRIVLDIISRILKILSHVKNRNASVYQYVKQQVNMLVESLPKNWQITRQSIKDTESELLRLNYLVELCKEDYIYSTLINKREFRTTLSKLLSIQRFTNKLEDEVKKEIKGLMHLFSTELKIERQMIVKAMGFKQGHWFKCPNGHFYTIGECGGAMQQNDCGKEMAAVNDAITTNASKNVYKCPKTTTVATRQTFNTSHRSYEQSSYYKRREPHYGKNDVEKKNPGTERNSTAEHKFTFKYLRDLSQKDSNEVISALASKKTDFEQFLLDVPSEFMAITIRVLGNVCRANFEDTVTRILVATLSSKFLDKLDDYLLRLPYEKEIEKRRNKLYHDDVGRFWTDLTDFFKKLIELLPSKACDGLRPILEKIGTIFEFIDKFQKDCRIDEKVKRVALTLHEILEAEVKRIEEKSKATRKPIVAAELETENPPDDYRELNVIPTLEDMINDKPFIRKCKINEPYSSVDHYLDVQFRLLREDFVCPLRNGLTEYLNPNPQKYRNNDLRIYRRVTLLSPGVQDNTVGVTVSFPPMSHVNWRQSKRLIYGGLVLLSNNHFKTILFFTVAYRDEKELAKGRILLEPCEGTVITRDMYNSTYVMLESKIYFEPYWAVLNVMKHLTENDFPMRKYLIDADNTRRLPEYIRDVDSLFYKYTRLPVAYGKVWPNAKNFNMDETQLNAFRSALTQEFSLVQGPPGTGKTFIALEIVGTLLNNQDYWKNYGPIVVVCLTNHALDQFLEGVLKYTKKVVRVGSRSRNEALKPYTLMERRKAMYFYGSTDAGSMMCYVKHDMEYILRNIRKTLLQISYLNLPDAIVPLDLLKENCNDPILQDFESDQDLLSWLIEDDINPYSISLDLGFNLADYNKEEQQVTTDLKTEYQSIDNIPEFEKYHKKSVMDDDLEYNELFKVDSESKPMFPLRKVNIAMTYTQKELIDYKNKQDKNAPFDPVIQEFHKRLDILTNIKQLFQQELKQHSVINPNRVKSNDIYWERYWYWIKDSYENAMNRLHQLEEKYRQTRLRLKDAKQLVDLHTLKHHEIVGMTTTGAAKIYSSVQALHAPIVVVEEAAEILESHVVCSLTKHCQQVILIGDHKQLQPKASVYKLGKNYNLNISLFERMVRIMGDYTQLGYQHRMRPQFAKLITPAIYKKLYNHEVVLDYPDVAGLEKNLFFLNHVQREENHDMDDSWTNRHEAEFLVAFARHLVLQGYSTKDITILCTYTGQLFTLTKEKSRYSSILQDLRVTTVDNFQGEENKIILLSLVRNNGEGNIGFLKEENRVCVALSRAREGLYIMGNMDDLVVKNNIWPQIKSVLEDENAIGDVLRLRCQIHSEQLVEVKNANDFQESPEGGCSKLCGVDMPCGHLCLSVCHMRDREHKEFSCRQPCLKACSFNHPCPLLCYEGCKACIVKVEHELRCGHTVEMSCSSDPDTFPCYIQVETTLPDCKHQIQKFCHFADELCSCTYPCDSRLPCGHTCKRTCHVNKDPDHIEYKCTKDCAKTYVGCDNGHPCKKKCFEECGLCPIKVEKTRSCGHFYKQAQCGEDLEKQPCVRPCKRDIPTCGHKCKQLCCEPCGKCEIIVEKKSIKCGHTLKIKCCNEAEPSKCNGKCPKTLPCGHPCTKKCKDQCTTKCQVMRFAILSHAWNYVKKKLKCDHPCVGFCGEPCPPLCRICNKDELTELLFGDEDAPDARFVFLEDCKHCIESSGLSKWLELDNDTIKVKTCPKCKTPIKKCARLMNQLKKDLNDVQLVKKKVFYGQYEDLGKIQRKRLETVKNMLKHATVSASLLVEYTKKYDAVLKKLSCIKRFEKKVQSEVLDALKNLQSEEKTAAIEKCMIVQAMGFKQGHWYKCPNGHPYVIGNNIHSKWKKRKTKNNGSEQSDERPQESQNSRGNEKDAQQQEQNNAKRHKHSYQTFNNNHQSVKDNPNLKYKRQRDSKNTNINHSFHSNKKTNETQFHFNYLHDLSEEDSNRLMLILASKKDDFEKFLGDVPAQLMAITLRVLNNVCHANFIEILSGSILCHTCSEKFLTRLENYLVKLPFESETDKINNHIYYDDINRFWTELTELFKKLMELLPSKACDGLRSILEKIGMIFQTIEVHRKDYKIEESIKNAAINLFEDLKAETKRIEAKNEIPRKYNSVDLENEDPPGNFRDLSIIPTMEDINNDKPFIRKFKINQPYNSVDHYLDVQYRLLREDFICPLRNGINEYLDPKSQKNRNSDLRVYKKVKLEAPRIHEDTVGITLCFQNIHNVNWQQSKRLIYGALLLLSNDNFNNILFMTVANRDEKELTNGRILVEPCEGTHVTAQMYNTAFVMLESKIYFEPYWAVLNAIKYMHEDNFPMKNYLINADNSIKLPVYLRNVLTLHYNGFELPVAFDKKWPNANELELDESQLKAFRNALTQEFSLIQGPPGTGKTFIALEIVHTLLANSEHWKKHGPIVVVCLTNHALDQFLEGILEHTNSIVRIGSRSKSEKLNPYILKEKKKALRIERQNCSIFLRNETKRRLERILKSIAETQLHVQYLKIPGVIVPFKLLIEYCNDMVLQNLDNNRNLIRWLVKVDLKPGSSILQPFSNRQKADAIVNDCEQMANILEFERYQNRHMDDKLDIDHTFEISDSIKPFFPIEELDHSITEVRQQIFDHKNRRDFVNLKPHEQELENHPLLNENRTPSNNLCWENYWGWVRHCYESAIKRLAELEEEYRQVRLQLNEAKQLVDLATLKQHKVVGLTTTGAAKLFSTLRELRAPIVLVEEAAEILESHVVCSLTKNCQQAILIGDHKQLQPKASVYKLGKDYNLNISLFERMVRIRGDCAQLAHQHRMRPQFAKLLTPSIYEQLYNDKTVFNRPNVLGLNKNLFFLNHSNREESHNNEESWVNKHEVEFLVAFARHLVLQGYKPIDITILCTYTGQLFAFMREKDRYLSILKYVRITTVDNFQGEENKIILLSLVRNNGEGNVGFLKQENRVCVALSRAKEGLYIMGNMDDLLVKNDIWPKIKGVLEEEKAIGDVLELRCQIHPDQLILIKVILPACKHETEKPCHVEIEEYRCTHPCDVRLGCGHTCTLTCHVDANLDPDHIEYKCTKSCSKNYEGCENNHPCKKRCFEVCGLCPIPVKKIRSCGHYYIQIACGIDIEKEKCSRPCKGKIPSCGHNCKLKCSDPCGNCEVMVEKDSLGCGHKVKVKCSEDATPSKCDGACPKILPCGHQCTNKCKDQCTVSCQVMEPCTLGCEHKKCKKRCSELCDIDPCNEPCKKKLKCDHFCVGFCGDPCPPLCRICDEKELTSVFLGREEEPNARFVFLEDCRHCIESNDLSAWLKQDNESIKVKRCPRCTTPIKKCARLINQIKTGINHVQLVKKKVFSGKYRDLQAVQKQHHLAIRHLMESPILAVHPELNEVLKDLDQRTKVVSRYKRYQHLNAQEIDACRVVLDIIRNVIEILSSVQHIDIPKQLNQNDLRIRLKLSSLLTKKNGKIIKSYEFVLPQLQVILYSIPRTFGIPKQRLNDIQQELLRLEYMIKVCNLDAKNCSSGVPLMDQNEFHAVMTQLAAPKRFDATFESEVLESIKKLNDQKLVIALERRMIVQAMGFKQGHWFKCPNGHFYTIGECGGAMQQSKCFECGADIGGSQHRLLSDNRLASEIDGATRSAWPGNNP